MNHKLPCGLTIINIIPIMGIYDMESYTRWSSIVASNGFAILSGAYLVTKKLE